MPEQIYIGNFAKGLQKDRLPFNIDNDAFPKMVNIYSWRGRAKRKRGTILLGQLQRQMEISASPNNWQVQSFNLVVSEGNLISQFTLGSTASITPTTVSLIVAADQTYTDPNADGTLTGSGGGTGTINYATGAFSVSGSVVGAVTGTFSYYPGLPVMGLRDFFPNTGATQYPLLLAFDTKYSYQINQNSAVVNFYSTSFYKGSNNPVIWSAPDYQQFWTTNYQNALWATNGKPGFHFVNATYSAGSGTASITMNFKTLGVDYTTLVIGDKIWFNEWLAGGSTINGLVGTVSDVTNAAIGNYIVTFSGNQTVAGTGIGQLLTSGISGQDGIKWYDGDPTNTTGLPTGSGLGWVNFAPPLSATQVTIDNFTSPTGVPFYLVGCKLIIPFKDRILFFGAYIQSSAGATIQLQDTVIWSWNGTPYYSIVPSTLTGTETADTTAYYVDQTGKGGYLTAGIQQPIVTVINNEDVLLVGFSGKQTRFVYTGNDLFPFNFFSINSELGSSSTFSGITLDRGSLTIGTYGIALTTQQSAQRVDLDIPDQVFQIQALNNGAQRVNSARDFFREWIYFSYPYGTGTGGSWVYPTQTFLYNYRDNTWAILYENFTTHGTYRKAQKYTWRTVPFATWSQWNEPWNSGSTSALFPSIIGGNPQGYVLIKGQGTGEGRSGTVQGISNNGGVTQINSINHCVTNANPLTGDGDFLYFQGCVVSEKGTITNITQASQAVISVVNTYSVDQYVLISQVVGMTEINGKFAKIVGATGTTITVDVDSTTYTPYASGGFTFFSPLQNQIGKVTKIIDADNFVVDIEFTSGTYAGLGNFTRLSQPLLQTKQFPVYWDQGRQVRLSAQKYLLDMTANGQITANIYLSQDPDDEWNAPSNQSIVYSQIVYTCPESTNIGLTPANINLQMPTAEFQYQIWHRYNTSMIGDSFQIGLTLSDTQMKDYYLATAEISLHGMHLTVDKGPHLA